MAEAQLSLLSTVEQSCRNCSRCSLCKTRNNVVFSDGVANGRLMLIGEAPGFHEDQEGKPFVGRSGKLLDKILESVGFSRDKNIYLCNVVKCRPPENRNPTPEEQNLCREYLDRQIAILKPKIILLCGSIATKAMLSGKEGITRIRGKWFDGPYGSKMTPIFHPSYLLRNPSHEVNSPKWLTWQDIREVRRRWEELE